MMRVEQETQGNSHAANLAPSERADPVRNKSDNTSTSSGRKMRVEQVSQQAGRMEKDFAGWKLLGEGFLG